jgi:hypothetical protein
MPPTVQGTAARRAPQAARFYHEPVRAASRRAPHLEPAQAAATVAQAAAALAQALKDSTDPNVVRRVAFGLSEVAAGLDAQDAAQAGTALTQALKDGRHPEALAALARALSAVAARLGPRQAAEAAAMLFPVLAGAAEPSRSKDLVPALSALLSAAGPEVSLRATSAAGAGQPLAALPFLVRAAEPPACRLSAQQLVELLKLPGCVGAARRVVLDQLGNRYKRRFGDLWEFVGWAQENEPGLDLLTPPQRPGP